MKFLGRYKGMAIYLENGVIYVDIRLDYIPILMFRQAMMAEKRLLDFAPCRIVPVSDDAQLGEVFGEGGTNKIFMIADNPSVAVKNAGLGKHGISSEYNSMIEMERLGMKTVVLGLRMIQGKIRLAMRRVHIATDSKSIVGYQGKLKGEELTLAKYVDPNQDYPQPSIKLAKFINRDLLESLLTGFDRMTQGNRCFSDFQFLITESSKVVYNDPSVYSKKQPNGSTITIIQAFIDTWEFLYSQHVPTMLWSEFKKYKKKKYFMRAKDFGQKLRQRHMRPVFTLIDPSFFRFSVPPRCACFSTYTDAGDLEGYNDYQDDGVKLYWINEFVTKRNKSIWTDSYKQ